MIEEAAHLRLEERLNCPFLEQEVSALQTQSTLAKTPNGHNYLSFGLFLHDDSNQAFHVSPKGSYLMVGREEGDPDYRI